MKKDRALSVCRLTYQLLSQVKLWSQEIVSIDYLTEQKLALTLDDGSIVTVTFSEKSKEGKSV